MLINIIVGLAGGIPIAIITALFKNKWGKLLGAFLVIGCNGVCIYIALVKAALLGISKSNDWAASYIVGVLQDIFIA
jgi:hypothetical protein